MPDQVLPGTSELLPVNPSIASGCNTLAGLFDFDEPYTISIPDYQRPYVWSTEQVGLLMKDLDDFFSSGGLGRGEQYYIGSLLLYRKDDDLAIIDGQQRITTLLMLDYLDNKEKSVLARKETDLLLFYNNPVSRENINRNQKYIRDHRGRYHIPPDFLAHLVCSIIITDVQDSAFTFFVTQNNRGVPLDATALLKSFHLRALENQEDLQRYFARNWDAEQKRTSIPWFFEKMLWRGRKWKGKHLRFENRDRLLKEFQDQQIKTMAGHIPLFGHAKNQMAASLSFSPQQNVQLQLKPVNLGQQAIDYPFAFRQPIAPGAGFFLYTAHFSALHQLLFNRDAAAPAGGQSREITRMNDFYTDVYQRCGLSEYLRDFFKLAVLLYYDQFGEQQLFAFTLWLDYLIGAYRVGQRNLMAQTVLHVASDPARNLLDVIASAYLPEEIFSFLRAACPRTKYEKEYKEGGVQGNYVKAIREYYQPLPVNDAILKQNAIYAKLRHPQT
jgi:hypothetical protein